jgi:hypothetical protein
MTKLFALALTFLLFAAVGAMVSMEKAPVDKDVGICYLAPIDQASDVVMYIADNNTPSMPDSRSISPGVEKPDYYVSLSSTKLLARCTDLSFRQSTTAKLMTTQKSNHNQTRDLGGLTGGEAYPRDGEQSRHI